MPVDLHYICKRGEILGGWVRRVFSKRETGPLATILRNSP